MVTIECLFLLLVVTVSCMCQEILPQGQRSCNDRDVDFLIQEIKSLKDDIRELKSRVVILEKNQVIQKDCLGWYRFGEREDGIYRISPDGVHSFEVHCDMKNGGWTMIQQRIDGSDPFNRSWEEYKLGFGNLSRDHWIGLNNIHLLTKHPVQISFELLMTLTGRLATATYYMFQVKNETTNFTMHVWPNGTYNQEMSKYISKAGGFYYSNGMQFSTRDRDNDLCKCDCANDKIVGGGGFWYNNCYELGGVNNDFSRMDIYDGISRPVSRVKIKVK